MIDYYKVLEIERSASYEVIKAAYKALIKKYHPDNYKGNSEIAKQKIVMINEAFSVLGNETKR